MTRDELAGKLHRLDPGASLIVDEDVLTCSSRHLIRQLASESDRVEPVREDQAAIIFSFASGTASRKVCIGVLPKHHRPWCGRSSL